MVDITLMEKEDAPFCKGLTDIEEWGNREDDFERLIDFEPEGCFVAHEQKRKVGMVMTTSYGNYAFLGPLIVVKEERGKGIGTRLMRHALKYLEKKGVATVELDSVFAAAPLYRRLGFQDKYLSLRFMRRPRGTMGNPPRQSAHSKIRDEIIRFDRKKTGIERERVVRRFMDDFSDPVHVINGKRLAGYGMVRQRQEGFFAIGPLIAEDSKAASIILSEIVSRYSGSTLTVGVPASKTIMVEMLSKNGFLHTPPSLRMYRGKWKEYENCVYGILSPEKG